MTIKVNNLYQGDNLAILKDIGDDFIDLIYLDPPFNTGKVFTSKGGSFNDKWTSKGTDTVFNDPALNDIIKVCGYHSTAMKSYVTFMTQRFIELHRVLKPTGSFYLHVDPTASHYLKIILDRVFGKNNFMNEIAWCYGFGGQSKKRYGKKHDDIFFYTKSDTYTFYKPQVPATSNMLKGKMKGISDWWVDIPTINNMAKERTGYPTQKPLPLLHRIIKASSNQQDLVLDPFCGSGTTCYAAKQLNRKWIGIDIDTKSADKRMKELLSDWLI